VRVVQRSRIILALADGAGVAAVASALGISPTTVRLWRNRFQEQGLQALARDAAGRGRKPILDEAMRQTLRRQFESGDGPGVRAMARELGVSPATVSRWRRRAT
jgi:transposase-like protein